MQPDSELTDPSVGCRPPPEGGAAGCHPCPPFCWTVSTWRNDGLAPGPPSSRLGTKDGRVRSSKSRCSHSRWQQGHGRHSGLGTWVEPRLKEKGARIVPPGCDRSRRSPSPRPAGELPTASGNPHRGNRRAGHGALFPTGLVTTPAADEDHTPTALTHRTNGHAW